MIHFTRFSLFPVTQLHACFLQLPGELEAAVESLPVDSYVEEVNVCHGSTLVGPAGLPTTSVEIIIPDCFL